MIKDIKATLLITIGILAILGLMAFGSYKLFTSNMFDTTGDYIKTELNKNNTEAFENSCESINYDKLINENQDYIGKPVTYRAVIQERSNTLGRNAEYIVNIPMDDKKVRQVKIKSLFERKYNVGDHVRIYGTYKGLTEQDGVDGKIPYIEAKGFVLDLR